MPTRSRRSPARRPTVEPPARRRADAPGHRRRRAASCSGSAASSAATTTDIAAAAGVAKGTLFLHARTKERLLIMVYEEEFRAAIREAFARPPKNLPLAKTLAIVLGRFFRVYERDVPLARHFVREVQFICRDDAADMCRVTDETLRRDRPHHPGPEGSGRDRRGCRPRAGGRELVPALLRHPHRMAVRLADRRRGPGSRPRRQPGAALARPRPPGGIDARAPSDAPPALRPCP